MTPVDALLLDLDGVLVRYTRPVRVRHLATSTGCTPAQVTAALFDSGLERRHDAGLDSAAYLQRLGSGWAAHWARR